MFALYARLLQLPSMTFHLSNQDNNLTSNLHTTINTKQHHHNIHQLPPNQQTSLKPNPKPYQTNTKTPKIPSTTVSVRLIPHLNQHLSITPRNQSNRNQLEPPLTPAERSIVKSYGGWTYFLLSYGLKAYNDEDAEEGLMILKALAEDDDGV